MGAAVAVLMVTLDDAITAMRPKPAVGSTSTVAVVIVHDIAVFAKFRLRNSIAAVWCELAVRRASAVVPVVHPVVAFLSAIDDAITTKRCFGRACVEWYQGADAIALTRFAWNRTGVSWFLPDAIARAAVTILEIAIVAGFF